MRQYLDLLKDVLENGDHRMDRTGTGARSLFGRQCRYDLTRGFPLLTTKKLHFCSILHELLWFLKGDTNIRYLRENQVSIWDEWADEEGNLGPVYGAQWRSWQGVAGGPKIDQIAELVKGLRENPESRRHLVSAWNPGRLAEMKLPPCHVMFQCFVARGRLSLQLYQRSADVFLGVPFNIASYAALTHMLARVCGLEPGEFIHSFGDVHLYENHVAQAERQLGREPRPLPQLRLNGDKKEMDDFVYEDFQVEGYDPWPGIKAPVAV